MSKTDFPLSEVARMTIGMHVLKCGLSDWLIDELAKHDLQLENILDKKHKIRRLSYDLDLRPTLNLLRQFSDTLFDNEDVAKSIVQTNGFLISHRDRHAHQQFISHDEITEWMTRAAELCETIGRYPTGQTLNALKQPPGHALVAAGLVLKPMTDAYLSPDEPDFLSYSEYTKRVDLALFGATEQDAFNALTWHAAQEYILGKLPSASLITLSKDEALNPPEAGLIGRSFWWIFDLAYDAPIDVRREKFETAICGIRKQSRWGHDDEQGLG